MPGESSNVLKSGHFFVSQIGDDFEHFSTVAIHAVDVGHDLWLTETLPVKHVASQKSSDEESGVIRIAHQQLVHY